MDYERVILSVGSLSPELIEHILLYIPYHTVLVLCKCSKKIGSVCDNSSFWKAKYIHDFYPILDPIAGMDRESYEAVISPSFLIMSCIKTNAHRDLLTIPEQKYISNELGKALQRWLCRFLSIYPTRP